MFKISLQLATGALECQKSWLGQAHKVGLICPPSKKIGVGVIDGDKSQRPQRSGGPANFGGIFRLYLNCAISRKLKQKSREITDV